MPKAMNERGITINSASPQPLGRSRIDWIGYVFIGFFAVPFLLFNVMPILFGVYVSFTEWSIIGEPKFIGFQNYWEALQDEWLRRAFLNVVLYALIIVPGVVVLGLFSALFVHQKWPLSALA